MRRVLHTAPSGEVSLAHAVPLAPWADMRALMRDDADPLEVIASIPAGKSPSGMNYTPTALQAIVAVVNQQGLPGYLGHQRVENVATEFPTPVALWTGARFEGQTALFRGVIDAGQPDLKRWLRARVVKQVSPFGRPTTVQVAGESIISNYAPLSIDFMPTGRAGVDTVVIALRTPTGEMSASMLAPVSLRPHLVAISGELGSRGMSVHPSAVPWALPAGLRAVQVAL